MQQMEVSVSYRLSGSTVDLGWLAGRIDSGIREELPDGVEVFEVRPGIVVDKFEGHDLRAYSGTLVLHFEYCSFADEDYDPEDPEDPAVDDAYIIEGSVSPALDGIADSAGLGNMDLSIELLDDATVSDLPEPGTNPAT